MRGRRAGGGRRHGAVLLEALVALTILIIGCSSIVITVSESAAAIRRAEAGERTSRAANAYLNVVALWTREDLARHVGTRRQGPWRMYIEHSHPLI
jgi:type II secretory pathway pseudopilin PulG